MKAQQLVVIGALVMAGSLLGCGAGVTQCTKNSDCITGFVCDTISGNCYNPNPGTDAGTDGGSNCTIGSCPGTNNICNYGTGACEAPKSCSSANPNPDVCSYGQFCSASQCSEVSKPTCAAFTSSLHASTWAKGSTAPVIYAMTLSSTLSPNPAVASGFCNGLTRYKVHVSAYSPTGSFPVSDTTDLTSPYTSGADETAMEGLIHLVDPNGNEISSTQTVQSLNVTNSQKNAEFDVNFCVPAGTTTYTAALHFYSAGTSGNEYCKAF